MPFINTKVSMELGNKKKESIKTKLGKAITFIPGKSEQWLMLGFEENCSLYFQGNNSQPSAMVEVKIFGSASKEAYNKLTASICEILEEEASIPKNRIYIKYEEISNWGWNGANF